ncbi:MAG: VOC family protein [Pseudomonadales bacterium]|nr:VOC family protein [Pseudomonadales bacterium]
MKCRNPIVIHYVYDMERARTFYTTVFDTSVKFASPGWTTLDFGAVELALHILSPTSRDTERPLPHAGLNLEVDDIEGLQERIERLGGSLVELREPQGGVPVRVATFRDCEGNGFELRQVPGSPSLSPE